MSVAVYRTNATPLPTKLLPRRTLPDTDYIFETIEEAEVDAGAGFALLEARIKKRQDASLERVKAVQSPN